MNNTRRWFLSGILACAGIARVAAAQDSAAATRVAIGAGVTLMEYDQNGDHASRGLMLRGGWVPTWFGEVSAVAQYWPDLGFWRGGSIVLETTWFPGGRSRVAPFIVFGLGYFRTADRLNNGLASAGGLTKTFGVGFASRLVGSWGIRLDGAVRFDPHAFDDELRIAVVTSPMIRRPDSLRGGSAQGVVYAFVPATGPWRPSEPGYGLAFATPVTAFNDIRTDVLLLHWHAEGNNNFSGWDTRALVVLPALSWTSSREGIAFHVGGGPAGTLMFEGPDDGLRGGLHAVAGVTIDLGSGFVASAAVSALWLMRSEHPEVVSPSQLPGTDERALLFRFGLGR